MKKVIVILIVLGLCFSQGKAVFAQTGDNNAMTKLGRGILNILDAIVEIPGTMMRESEAEGVGSGITKGTIDGIVNTVVRALVGVFEVATFALPIPENYEPILDDPKFLSTQ